MTDDAEDNVVPISAGQPQPLALILRRRQNIAARRRTIDAEIRALREEGNGLFREDQELAAAEAAIRRLLKSSD